MLKKLLAIGVIVIVAIIILSSEPDAFFEPAQIDSIQDNAAQIGSEILESAEAGIDKTTDVISNQTDSITTKLDTAKNVSERIITEEIPNLDPVDSIQDILTGE